MSKLILCRETGLAVNCAYYDNIIIATSVSMNIKSNGNLR